jgi:predicted nucleotide-binding protein with TIR-like domain
MQLDHPKTAIVIGKSCDDPVVEIVEKTAEAHGFSTIFTNGAKGAVSHLKKYPELGKEMTLILLRSEFLRGVSIEQWTAELYRHRTNAARIVVYALPGQDSGQLAMGCIREKACDYIVRNLYDLKQIEERIRRAVNGEPPYGTIRIPYVKDGNKAFIVTPFGPPLARDDYFSGIVPALKSLNIVPERGDEELQPTFLQRKICEQIDESGMVIANVSQYGAKRANPNVYFEIGYALGRGKPIIFVRRINEGSLPADLNGIVYREYKNYTDLALCLYFGLRRLFES